MIDLPAKHETEALETRASTSSLEVLDLESYELAGDILTDVKAKIQLLENERKELTAPLRKSLDGVNAFFKRVSSKYVETETDLKKKMLFYRALQQEAEAKAIETLTNADGSYEHAMIAIADATLPAIPGVSIRHSTTWELADLTLVPQQYFCLDQVKINAAVRAGITIPGIRTSRNETLAASRKKS